MIAVICAWVAGVSMGMAVIAASFRGSIEHELWRRRLMRRWYGSRREARRQDRLLRARADAVLGEGWRKR